MKWFRKKKDILPEDKTVTKGLLIFSDTNTVMCAEQILKEEGYDIRVVCPPAQYRTGCDLCVEFSLVEEPGIIRLLEKLGSAPIDAFPESSKGLRPQKLCRIKDFGQYIMVRAANMKITVDKKSLQIVNISGGGCPDVPYLAYEMVGKSVSKAPKPSVIGHTLCAYALNTAYKKLIGVLEINDASFNGNYSG